MADFIHHHTASPITGGEEDGFDVIETDEISVYQGSFPVQTGFETVEEAIRYADNLADEIDVETRKGARWQRNYAWNLAALSEPGGLDPNYSGSVEELAREYADIDTAERQDRGN